MGWGETTVNEFLKLKAADAWLRMSSEFVYSTNKRYKPIYIILLLYNGYIFLTLHKSSCYRFCRDFKSKFIYFFCSDRKMQT